MSKIQRKLKEIVEKIKAKKGYQVTFKRQNIKVVNEKNPNEVIYLKSLKNYYFNVIKLEEGKEKPTKLQSATNLEKAAEVLLANM